MGFLAYAVAGGGFAVIGAWESLDSSNPNRIPSPGADPSSPLTQIRPSVSTVEKPVRPSFSSSVALALFSFFFVVNSILSFFNSVGSHDRVGSMLQLQILAIAALFLGYSILGFLINSKNAAFAFPSSITNLILLFGFIEEFLLFYLQRKDTSGIENRYYDLMLVPIGICVVATVFELKSETKTHRSAKLGRGIGLILQGTWFLQMGVSFFTDLIASGCSLHEKSRGNFTIKCKGHDDYHRARAIATLQFNCHLALMVVLATGLFSIMANKYGLNRENLSTYRPLGSEMTQMENLSSFTLDSEEEDEESTVAEKEDTGLNGYGSHS